MKTNARIRVAREEDAEEILSIYQPFILETAVTFEEEVPALSVFQQRIATIMEDNPFFVCELENRIVGFAYASAYRSRAAYRWTREVSVYVHPDFQRKNIARALYHVLLATLKRQEFITAFGVITLPNQGSVALHESFGFRPLSIYKHVGFKLGRWHDVGWWELSLTGNSDATPKEIIPFSEIKYQDEIDQWLKNAETFLHI